MYLYGVSEIVSYNFCPKLPASTIHIAHAHTIECNNYLFTHIPKYSQIQDNDISHSVNPVIIPSTSPTYTTYESSCEFMQDNFGAPYYSIDLYLVIAW